MEFVLVGFQVSQLRELLVASIQLTCEGLGRRVDDLVRSYVAVLSECLAADVAPVRPLAGMSSFVRLEVAKLAESLAAGWFFA
jgi:hypothetical protein